MKKRSFLALRQPPSPLRKNLCLLAPIIISASGALFASLWLHNTESADLLTTTIIAVGMDELRAQLIAALLLALCSSFSGALVGRRLFGATLGAGLSFYIWYLRGFIYSQQLPLRDPGGNLEPLNNAALVHNSILLLGLALLSAFFGAAIGISIGRVLLDPIYHLLLILWRYLTYLRSDAKRVAPSVKVQPRARAQASLGRLPVVKVKRSPLELLGSWLGALSLVALLLISINSGDLFVFSPDLGIHNAPTLHTVSNQPTTGTLIEDSLISPTLKGARRSFIVYLPPSYNTPAGQHKRYPTLYLLFGSPGKIFDWSVGGKADQSANTLIDLGKIPELIMIYPDGHSNAPTPSEWGNGANGQQRIEDYLVHDVVQYVDQKYRTINSPDYRGIGGNSMGAFGATNIAIHHPDLFGFVISLGGYYYSTGQIWGHNPNYLRANSPADQILTNLAARKIRFYLGAATKDQPYHTDTLQFAHTLQMLRVSYKLDVQKGYHSWLIWQVQLYNALIWLPWGPATASPLIKPAPIHSPIPKSQPSSIPDQRHPLRTTFTLTLVANRKSLL